MSLESSSTSRRFRSSFSKEENIRAVGSLGAETEGVEGEMTLLNSGRRGKLFSKGGGVKSCEGSANFFFSTVGSTILRWVSLFARWAKLNVGIVLDGIPMERRLQLNS